MNILRFLFTLAWLGGSFGIATAQDYEPRVFANPAGDKLPYRWLAPASLEPGRKYPLVLFLHGAGERGTNNSAQLVHGTKLYLDAAHRTKFPCFVLAPQCPAGKQWVDMPWGGTKARNRPSPASR